MSKELKVLELFSGIGSQHKALTNIGIKSICTQCDIDKYAIQAYNAIHGETENLGNISLIDESKFVRDQWDLVTYSSPCQDFSFAGLQKGGEKGSGTRSSLLWEVEKIVKQVHPKYLLMENVKALVSKKFLSCFEKWIETLNSYGYKTYWKVLNAKNYGIPQNRERVFAVSIRNDIDQSFEFPSEQKLEKRLKDVLESNVDAKYYLSERVQNTFMNRSISKALEGQGFRFKPYNPSKADIAFAVTTKAGGRMTDNFVFNKDYNDNKFVEFNESMIAEPQLNHIGDVEIKGNDSIKRVYDENVLSPTLTTMEGGNRQPKILVNDIKTMYNPYHDKVISDVAPTQTANCGNSNCSATVLIQYNDYRIRKLTPRECYRLMGFSDEDFDKVKSVGMSDTQCYKQAGNSIVVNCLMAIFTNMFKDTDYMDSSENRGV